MLVVLSKLQNNLSFCLLPMQSAAVTGRSEGRPAWTMYKICLTNYSKQGGTLNANKVEMEETRAASCYCEGITAAGILMYNEYKIS